MAHGEKKMHAKEVGQLRNSRAFVAFMQNKRRFVFKLEHSSSQRIVHIASWQIWYSEQTDKQRRVPLLLGWKCDVIGHRKDEPYEKFSIVNDRWTVLDCFAAIVPIPLDFVAQAIANRAVSMLLKRRCNELIIIFVNQLHELDERITVAILKI